MKNRLVGVLLLLLSFTVLVNAEDDYIRHSLRTNPIGFLSNSYLLDYEYNITKDKSIQLECSYMNKTGNLFNNQKNDGFIGFAQFKMYDGPDDDPKFLFWEADRENWFWGPFIKYMDVSLIDMEIEEKIDGETQTNKYTLQLEGYAIGASFGRRYFWDSGLTVGFRFGYGIPILDAKWDGAEPKEKTTFEAFSKFAMGIDGELSIGFSF